MKKKWIALIIMVTSLCFACACSLLGNDNGTSSETSSQGISSESTTGGESSSNTTPPEESSSGEPEVESGVNGGYMKGDNDLDWNNPEN